jgi:hypothetical protein
VSPPSEPPSANFAVRTLGSLQAATAAPDLVMGLAEVYRSLDDVARSAWIADLPAWLSELGPASDRASALVLALLAVETSAARREQLCLLLPRSSSVRRLAYRALVGSPDDETLIVLERQVFGVSCMLACVCAPDGSLARLESLPATSRTRHAGSLTIAGRTLNAVGWAEATLLVSEAILKRSRLQLDTLHGSEVLAALLDLNDAMLL